MIAEFLVVWLLIAYVENVAGGFKAEGFAPPPILIYIQELNSVLSLGFRVNGPCDGYRGLLQYRP